MVSERVSNHDRIPVFGIILLYFIIIPVAAPSLGGPNLCRTGLCLGDDRATLERSATQPARRLGIAFALQAAVLLFRRNAC